MSSPQPWEPGPPRAQQPRLSASQGGGPTAATPSGLPGPTPHLTQDPTLAVNTEQYGDNEVSVDPSSEMTASD